jgi:gas vesicle protein
LGYGARTDFSISNFQERVMSGKRSGGFLVGMVLGAAVGAITGLLIAPRTGPETRRIIRKSADALPDLAEDLSSTVQIQADRISEGAMKNWDSTLARLKDAIGAGIEATRQAQQVSDDGDEPSIEVSVSRSQHYAVEDEDE